MKRIKVLLVWMLVLKVVSSRHLIDQDNNARQSKDDVEQESNLEFQLDQLFRQLSPSSGSKLKSTGLTEDEFVEGGYEDDTFIERTKDSARPRQFGQTLEDDPSSPEVVYGKLVFYPSSVPVDPTHRSSTEVESAILSQFRPPIIKEQRKITTTASPKKGGSSKRRRKNERKAAKEEKMLENLIQLAEKYGTETKLGDMLKKLCGDSTVSCRGFDTSKEADDLKKNTRKQNAASKQQNSRKNGRRSKNSKNSKNQNLPSLTTDEPERKRNKQNRRPKSSRRNKNSKTNNVVLTNQDNAAATSSPLDLVSGINKPESKKRRRLSGSSILPTREPSDNLEEELIDLGNGNGRMEDRITRRMKKHRSMKNDTRDRLQKHIHEQIDLHRRIQHENLK